MRVSRLRQDFPSCPAARGGYKIRLELLNLFLTLRQAIEDYYKPSFLEVKKYAIEIRSIA
jgi:hypothetical protein